MCVICALFCMMIKYHRLRASPPLYTWSARGSTVVQVVSAPVCPPSSMPRTLRAGPPLYTWSASGSTCHRACPVQCAQVRHCTLGQLACLPAIKVAHHQQCVLYVVRIWCVGYASDSLNSGWRVVAVGHAFRAVLVFIIGFYCCPWSSVRTHSYTKGAALVSTDGC